jgi:hypothetical protein
MQVLACVERLMERVSRFGEVLPSYQMLASELLECLEVKSLDDILPAVRALLGRQNSSTGRH